jgi:hypothetical protein
MYEARLADELGITTHGTAEHQEVWPAVNEALTAKGATA